MKKFEIVSKPESREWDRYAEAKTAAKYSHRCGWGESLSATYGHSLHRLAAINSKTRQICGILALVLLQPPGQNARLISLPYTDAAGILADDDETGLSLLTAGLQLAETVGADHIEFRQDGAPPTIFEQFKVCDNWSYTPHYFKTGLRRTLPPEFETLWTRLPAKVRNQVRKARRSEATIKTGKQELLSDFYAVFSENMRDLGSPVHDVELFRSLLHSDSLRTGIIVVYLGNIPAAASFVLQLNDTLYNPWASSLRRYRPLCPNMLLYWSMLAYGIEHRCLWFDFGRSTPHAPTCRFKMQWGATMEPLGWHIFSRKPHQWHPGNESLEIETWKSMDLTVSRQKGPTVRRWISL